MVATMTKKKATKKKAAKVVRSPGWHEITAEALEAARKRRGMSKAAWARYLGVGLSTYWNWVRGLNVPARTRQRRLLAVLDAASGLALVAQRAADSVTGAESQAPTAAGTAETATFMSVRGLAGFASESVHAAAVSGVTAVLAAMAGTGKLSADAAPALATAMLSALLGRA
jgi:DNA-binding transcriptional regulator YiaG